MAGVIVNGELSRSGGRPVEVSGVNGARAGKHKVVVEAKRSWVDSINDNRLLSKSLQMKYSPPMIVELYLKWKSSLQTPRGRRITEVVV